jgi:archaellum component FlaD/FlaE
LYANEEISFLIQVIIMELDKRVEGVETELKVVKGEIKNLLVDIRDHVNKNENPFFNSQIHGVSRLETKEKGTEKENQLPVNEEKLENEKNKEIAQDPVGTISPDKVLEENMPRQKTQLQTIESENQVRKMDTFTLVELMRWVDYAVRTVGHSNLKVLIDLYEVTGQLPEEVKYVIENIANLPIEESAGEEKVNMKDNITVLSQLNAILNPGGFRNKVHPSY